MNRDLVDRASSAILTIAAVVVAGVVVSGYRRVGTADVVRSKAAPPERVSNWAEIVDAGAVVGNPNASLQVVEFGDFECPYCRRFSAVMDSVQQELGDSAGLVFVHMPLASIHRFALPAARAAECAATQDRFSEFYHALYGKQDSLGLKPWIEYATEAGVADTIAFKSCVRGSAGFSRIDRGIALARKLEITSTPTVIVNGWRYAVPPPAAALLALARLGTGSRASGVAQVGARTRVR